jgi:hypothetical protein
MSLATIGLRLLFVGVLLTSFVGPSYAQQSAPQTSTDQGGQGGRGK